MDLTDVKSIRTSISELSPIERSFICNICTGTLKEHANRSALMICEKCKRYSLRKNNTETINTSIVLKNGENLLSWLMQLNFSKQSLSF